MEAPGQRSYSPEELGPPLGEEFGYTDNEVLPSAQAELDLSREPLRITPELLDPHCSYRRRRQENLVMQIINNQLVLLTRREYQAAWAIYRSPLFRQEWESGGDELFYPHDAASIHMTPYSEGTRIDWEAGSPNELNFLVRELPAEERAEIEGALSRKEKINVDVIWGPKWKISRFSDGHVARFDYPPADEIDPSNQGRKFQGSNFVVFTKISLGKNKAGELCLTEQLIAEANIGSKSGNYTTVVEGQWGKETIKIDRSLPGLVQRHAKGDPYLREEEYLYNQFSRLTDAVPPADKRWVRSQWITFLKSQLPTQHLVRSRPVLRFRVNAAGHVVTDEEAIKRQIDYTRPLRVNVEQGGYLYRVLANINERTHLHRRLEKYRAFMKSVYPAWRAVWDERGSPGVAEDIFRTEANRKRLLVKNRQGVLPNLSYLLYCFAVDPTLKGIGPSGIGLAEEISKELRAYHQYLTEKGKRDAVDLKEGDWEKTTQKVTQMLRPDYFARAPDASWVEELTIRGPKRGLHHPLNHPLANYRRALFRREARLPLREQRERRIAAFDLLPPRTAITDEQRELAGVFLNYCREMANEGIRPTPYMLWRDSEERTLGTLRISGNWIYNRARVLFRDPTPPTHSSSSQAAIKALFELANCLLPELTTTADREVLRHQLDYASMVEAAKELIHISGRIGEIFAHLALEADATSLLELSDPANWSCKIIFENIDRRGKYQLIDRFTKGPGGPTIVPDAVIAATYQPSGATQAWLVEVKTYIKSLSGRNAVAILHKYQPYLDKYRLVVIANFPSKQIRPEARRLLSDAGVMIKTAEDVATALTQADHHKYQLPAHFRFTSLPACYKSFVKHPAVFAEHSYNRELLRIFEEVATERNPLFVNQLTEDLDRLYREGDLT